MNLKMLVATAAAAVALSSQAHALTFTFSFDNNVFEGGNVDGTVTGRILGLQDNSAGGATDVVIDSVPDGVTGLPGKPFTVADYASDLGLFISQNFFVVNNRHIDFAIYQIWGGYFDMNVPCCGVQFNSMVSPDGLTRVQNLEGMNGLTFTATPEPASWALMLMGFGGLGAVLRTRRQVAVA